MKLDYKKLKKIHEDEHSTTLEHGDGHTVRVAHGKLTEENRKLLKNVPMYATGGEIDEEAPPLGSLADAQSFNPNETPQAPAAMQDYTAVPGISDFITQGIQNSYSPTDGGADRRFSPQGLNDTSMIGGFASREARAAEDVRDKEAIAAIDASSPKIPTTTTSAPNATAASGKKGLYEQGLGEMEQGLRAGATAQQDYAKAEEALAADKQAKQQVMQQEYQNSYQELEQSRKALIQDIKDGHINPSQFMDNKSDLGKISTAIGLIMGGIGGEGKANPALDFINKQIDRDIEAQKANLGKKQNLLSATMQQFGNLKDAMQMARVYQTDIYAAKMEEAMAHAKSPMAKAALQKAIGELHMTSGPVMEAAAQKKAMMSGVKSGAATPAMAVQYMVPEAQRNEAFKEIEKVQNTEQAIKDIDSYGKQMARLQSTESRVGSPLQSRSQISALNTKVYDAMHKIFGAFSDTERAIAEKNSIEYMDSPETIQTKLSALKSLSMSKGLATPILDSVGIPINKPSSAPAHKAIKDAPKRGK